MTLLFLLMDRQTYLLQKSELAAEQLAAAIRAGDWSFAGLENLWISEQPRQVTVLDGMVIVSAALPQQALPTAPDLRLELDFTPRQTQILEFLMEGLTLKEISARLKISKRTIDVHIEEIKKKLEARTIAQSVGRAVALGYGRPRRAKK
jgi:DNA-binding NarL/FixJ family response regulator